MARQSTRLKSNPLSSSSTTPPSASPLGVNVKGIQLGQKRPDLGLESELESMENLSDDQGRPSLRTSEGHYTDSSEVQPMCSGWDAVLAQCSDSDQALKNRGWGDVLLPSSGEEESQPEGSSANPPTSPPPDSDMEPSEHDSSSSLEPDPGDSDNYLPSDEPGGQATLKKKRREKAAKMVDSSGIDKNEKDQAQRKAIHDDQVEYEKRKSMLEETLEVLRSLDVMGPGRQLSEKVICNYLLDHWWDLRFAPGKRPLYLPFAEVHQLSIDILSGGVDPADSFQNGAFCRLYRSVAPRPKSKSVCFFLHRNQATLACGKRGGLATANHFFPVVFDYEAHMAHCFGLVTVETADVWVQGGDESGWACWMGPELWMWIGQELGWAQDIGDVKTVSVVTKNWKQNGYDCGMYSLNILHRLNLPGGQGQLLDQITPEDLSHMCLHHERTQVLDWTMGWIHSSVLLFQKLGGDPATYFRAEDFPSSPEDFSPLDLDHIKCQRFNGVEIFTTVRKDITSTALLCPSCTIWRREEMRTSGMKVDSGVVIKRSQQGQNRPGGQVQHMGGQDGQDAAVPQKQGTGEDQDQEIGEDQEQGAGTVREPEDVSEGEEESVINYRKELLHLAQLVGGTLVKGRREAIRQSKSVQPYRFKEERPIGVVKEFDPGFDSYKSGPTAEALVEAHIELCLAFISAPVLASRSTVGDRFSDHGYRRTAGGFHQFYLNEPSLEDQLAHFFPLPSKEVIAEWKKKKESEVDMEELLQGHPADRGLPEGMIKGNDFEEWDLEQMVGPESGDKEEGMRRFVTGKTESGKFIRLNIHKSRKVVRDLEFSADIDSIIWVTDKLKVAGSVNLQLLPHKKPKAPIGNHNHTYVELFWPRTQMDFLHGRRSTASQEVPISNLPNTSFAHFGRAEGSAEILVVFPRMKHKYPLKRVWETKIPYEVETFWLGNLVYPALRKLGSRGVEPYTDWTLDDMQFKHRGQNQKGIQVSSEHLEQILETIKGVLEEKQDDELYSRFGSLFFVLQILGIKISTNKDSHWEDLWWKLVQEHQNLDWSYMEDPENGELLVDLGFGIHPPTDADVVGFWDVDATRVGYDYGGYGRGTTHSVNTVPAVGGIHAEMTTGRRKRTHIAYRLSYNLYYEVLRGQKTKDRQNFFSVRSAYQQDDTYTQSISGVIDAYRRNMHKSYGVRDEYRCRARSMKKLLPLLLDKLEKYLQHLDPIIWLSTPAWFTFLQGRIKALSNFQEKLYLFKTPPENYGALTVILTHMVQHVGVTPIVTDPELRRHLGELRFDAICQRFGCFFLHDLNLANGHLPGVQEKDNLQTMKKFGIKFPRQKRRGEAQVPSLLPSQDALTWKELGERVNAGHERAQIREFVWDPLWSTYLGARSLFCQFTENYWLKQTAKTFTPLQRTPLTLQEAMQLWTLQSVKERVGQGFSIHLTPSVDKLGGHIPRKSKIQVFENKRISFFPEPEAGLPTNPHWKPFFSTGYVKTYHDTIKCTSDGGKEIRDMLDGIFRNLQVLPLNPGKPKDVRQLWKWNHNTLQLLLNSSYIQLADRTILFKRGKAREKNSGGPSRMRSNKEVEALLEEKFIKAPTRRTKAVQKSAAAVKAQLMKGRVGKSKNYRRPPVKGKQAEVKGVPVAGEGGGYSQRSKGDEIGGVHQKTGGKRSGKIRFALQRGKGQELELSDEEGQELSDEEGQELSDEELSDEESSQSESGQSGGHSETGYESDQSGQDVFYSD